MEPEVSMPHSQVPATCLFHGPARSSPYPQLPLPEDPSGSFPQISPPKPCVRLFFPPYALHAPSISFFSIITRTILGEEYRSLIFSICSFLHSLVASSLLGPNIFLNTLFSNTISLRPSLNLSDHVSHPYKTTGKIIFLNMLIFIFVDSKLEDKRSCTEW